MSLQLRATINDQLVNLKIQQCQYVILYTLYDYNYYKPYLLQTSHTSSNSKRTTDDAIPYIAKLMLTYGISYECYHELSSVVKELPRTHKVY